MDINCILFENYETLDLFGPVEVLGIVDDYRLRFFSQSGGIVNSRHGVPVMTEDMGKADMKGIVLLPGAKDVSGPMNSDAFLARLRAMAEQAEYCLTVCTGSAILAKTGLLNGRRATSNKMAFAWVKETIPGVNWLPKARWTVDGKYYTSSGVSAGMDMALGFVADRLGVEQARRISTLIEYTWNADKDDDPFCQE